MIEKDNCFVLDEYEDKLIEECKIKRIPAVGIIELTPLCNFNCNMCYIHLTHEQMQKKGKMMSKEQIIDIARQAVDMGLYQLSLTGGEIFTRPDIREIYEAIYDMGVLIRLRTNGYAINDSIIEWLKIRKPHDVQITLYGSDNKMYEKVCGINKGYDIVTSNIDKLLMAHIPVHLAYTGTNDNIGGYESARKWANKRRINMAAYLELITPDRGTGRIVDNKRVDFKPLPMEVPIDATVDVEEKHFAFNKPFNVCRNYGAQFTLKWNGKLSICINLHSTAVDATNIPFSEAYRLIYEKADKIKHPYKCKDCKYVEFCDACPSHLESETGDPEGVSEYLCTKAKWNHDMYWCQQQEAKRNEGKE